MSKAMQTVFAAARKLTSDEREELAELLLATIETESGLDAAWRRAASQALAEQPRPGDAVGVVEAGERGADYPRRRPPYR